MASYNEKEIVGLLNGWRSGNKGWFQGDCPYCGKAEKLGFIFGHKSSFHCLVCKEHGTMKKLLHRIDRTDLMDAHDTITTRQITTLTLQSPSTDLWLEEYQLPIGWRRTFDHPYLNGRGFTQQQYLRHPVGTTKLDPKYKNYIIFEIIERHQTVGFIGRLIWNKEKIDQYQQSTGKKVRKYLNSEIDFEKCLYGFDDITLNTTTAIVVEGLTDKFNVDRLLDLYSSEQIRCVCTFGKKISESQINKLKTTNIATIILMYDDDAIEESKKFAFDLKLAFPQTFVAYIENGDPGDLTLKQCLDVMERLYDPLEFNLGKVRKIQ